MRTRERVDLGLMSAAETFPARVRDERGFTLIELLVVILIIGILAAIALPAFLNQRSKAHDANAKEAVRSAQTAIETFYTDHQTYVGADVAALTGIEPTLLQAAQAVTAGGNALTVSNQTGNGYRLSVTSQGGQANTFTITTSGGGIVTRSCTAAGEGGCPASGSW
jgi:type IV pilus assembly protein PilA